jgi:hypothetical protein
MSSNSAADDYQSVYGLRFVQSAQVDEKVNAMIFSFDDPELLQIHGFSRKNPE